MLLFTDLKGIGKWSTFLPVSWVLLRFRLRIAIAAALATSEDAGKGREGRRMSPTRQLEKHNEG